MIKSEIIGRKNMEQHIDKKQQLSKTIATTNNPRVTISVSVQEILALKEMLLLGRLFTRPDRQVYVQAVMDRIGVKLKKIGVPFDIVDRPVRPLP